MCDFPAWIWYIALVPLSILAVVSIVGFLWSCLKPPSYHMPARYDSHTLQIMMLRDLAKKFDEGATKGNPSARGLYLAVRNELLNVNSVKDFNIASVEHKQRASLSGTSSGNVVSLKPPPKKP